MSRFDVHTHDTAPDDSKQIMKQVEGKYGFVPNLIGVMAEAPALAEGYTTLSGIFEKTSFSPAEQQVVLLAVSHTNGCSYCMAAHSVIAQMKDLPEATIEALRQGGPIPDDKLEALRRFTVHVVEERGWPSDDAVQSFLDAGYAKANVLEVILGVGMKTLSNYTNHLADTPVDSQFEPMEWKKAS